MTAIATNGRGAKPTPRRAVDRLDAALRWLDEAVTAADEADPSCKREAGKLRRLVVEATGVHADLVAKQERRKHADAAAKARRTVNGDRTPRDSDAGRLQ